MMTQHINDQPAEANSRRRFLQTAALCIGGSALPHIATAADAPRPNDTYETHAQGIRILPGQWRPHYPWEHIAWVSPSWPSQDYVWLDFPEAIFTSQGLIYLSHINPPIHTVYESLPRVAWRHVTDGIAFERTLPSGIQFGGSVVRRDAQSVDLRLDLTNGSGEPLRNITLQTCAFLRGIREFAEYTADNKLVHVAGEGWLPMAKAVEVADEREGAYRVGWRRSGKAVADLPVVVTLSRQAERLMAMTWLGDTLSMVSNPGHPCVHADPHFKDLAPGQSDSVHGRLIFFEGKLADFDFADYIDPPA